MKKGFLNIIIWLFALVPIFGQQDAMFTRYGFIQNMHFNPAATGRYDGIRSSIAYRSQWANVDGGPSTVALGIEKSISNNRAGIGINVFHDRIGFDRHTALNFNYAYKIPLSGEWSCAIGMKAGIGLLSSSFVDAITPQPGVDPIHTNPYEDWTTRAGVGLLLTNGQSYISLSVPNFLSVNQSRILITDNDAFLSKHYYGSLGHIFTFEDSKVSLKPSIFLKYHPAAPFQVDVNVMAWYADRVAFGLSYRTGDAVSGILEIAVLPSLVISYAYDYTTSDFRQIGGGAHEIILYHTFEKSISKVPSIHKFKTMPKI